MGKVFSRKVMSTVVAGSLLFSAGSAVVIAAPAPKEDKKETGRTEQNAQTGVTKYNDVTVERYQKEVRLSGTVVIDGPQLVVKINGTENAKVTKLGDKLWAFEANVDVSLIKGDADYEISAYTIYANGNNAGKVHTSAPNVTQTIHVPYIKSIVADNTEWTAYDRSSNKFTVEYDEVKEWSKGDREITAKTQDVDGLEEYVTFEGTTTKEKVPTANRDFTFSETDTWDFEASSNSVTFKITITDSKGFSRTESVIKTGLEPGVEQLISHSVTDDYGTITKTVSYTAPKTPVVAVPVGLKNLEFIPVFQNQNRLKMKATYQVVYSDETIGETQIIEEFDGTLGNPTGNQKDDITKDYIIEGFVYTVTAHYNAVNKTYYATWELKK